MKVTDPGHAVVPAVSARPSATPAAEPRPSVGPQDKVSLRTLADDRAIATAQAAATTGRFAKVQEVINAVKSGQYFPSPQQIAQQMVSESEATNQIRSLMKE
jgi:anti-sigma28 factor (negative regulator of flagellin synthesis)